MIRVMTRVPVALLLQPAWAAAGCFKTTGCCHSRRRGGSQLSGQNGSLALRITR